VTEYCIEFILSVPSGVAVLFESMVV
jgi:hypothetical protein